MSITHCAHCPYNAFDAAAHCADCQDCDRSALLARCYAGCECVTPGCPGHRGYAKRTKGVHGAPGWQAGEWARYCQGLQPAAALELT